MADYVMREMNDVRGDGSKTYYPQIDRFRLFSEDEFVEKMATNGSGLSAGQVESVLTALKLRLSEMLALGYTVKVRGLGTFSTSLGVKEGKDYESGSEDEVKRNAQSIEVRNIRFKADRDLISLTDMKCNLVRRGEIKLKKVKTSEEERLNMALEYLQTHPFMKVADYRAMTGLNHSYAAAELRKFSGTEGSGIRSMGRGSHKVYVKE
jgi:predicted histone-like DNA-binding protein